MKSPPCSLMIFPANSTSFMGDVHISQSSTFCITCSPVDSGSTSEAKPYLTGPRYHPGDGRHLPPGLSYKVVPPSYVWSSHTQHGNQTWQWKITQSYTIQLYVVIIYYKCIFICVNIYIYFLNIIVIVIHYENYSQAA